MTDRSLRAKLVGLLLGLTAPLAVLAQEQVTLQSGALTLNGTLVLADGQGLSDGIILLTHGTLAHNGMETIQGLQNVLEERGISTLAITLGLGISDRKGFYDCTIPSRHLHTDALVEIGQWLTWLEKQGAENITLMGHSRGGNQTGWFAAENGDAGFDRVILLAPMLADPVKEAASYEGRYGVPLSGLLAQAQDMVAAGKGDDLMDVPGILYCKDSKASAASFVSYYAPDPRRDTATLLPRIGQPVLVIGGTADEVVTGLEAAVGQLADGDGVALVMIEDADHAFLDFSAEDVADAIEGFLGQ